MKIKKSNSTKKPPEVFWGPRGFQEECAIFGIWNHPEASRLSYLGLYALQHRGQEASGLVSLSRKGEHLTHKGRGLVADVFKESSLDFLKGRSAIGHNRYSTTSADDISNIQPLKAELFNGPVSLAHNGNIINFKQLHRELKKQGSIFRGTSDTEVILHLLAKNQSDNIITCLKEELPRIKGAYSLVLMTKKELIAVRDPMGFRPLVLGEILDEGNKSMVLSSETCALDLIGARFVRQIQPGEIYLCDNEKEESFFLKNIPKNKNQCVFEHIYFARPDSEVFGQNVYQTRRKLGAFLAEKDKDIKADMVIPVPDSGVPAALGYSQKSGLPFEFGIIRNHYVGRTFIEPKQSIRSFGVKVKLNPQKAVLKGKKVVVVDDSLVRGTTSRKIISLVRSFGASEVHMRIAAPPTISPCHYGVDTPDKDQLIAGTQSLEEIRNFIGADTLNYVSMDKLTQAVKDEEQTRFCFSCFTDRHPSFS